MPACPYCAVELGGPVPTRCPHCDGRIHVYSSTAAQQPELLTTDEMESVKRHERGHHLERLNVFRERSLRQWAERRAKSGEHIDVQIRTRGNAACPACRALEGRVYSLDEALERRPLPCRECTTTLLNGWENFCRCTYGATGRLSGHRM